MSRTFSRRAALAASLLPGCAVAGQISGADPDAALIALCTSHVRNLDAYNSHGGRLEPEDDPLWLAYSATRDAISEARPQTMRGMLAKAQAAKFEARIPEGGENPSGTPAEGWAWDLVQDLLRLEGTR